MKFFVATIVIALLATSAFAQSCSQASTCNACASLGGCGWCSYSNLCEAGNQTGSFVGCTTPYWTWSAASCPATPAPTANPCSGYTTCTTCAVGSCGWCSFSNTCELGNVTGSFVGCTTPYWSWTQQSCPTTPAPSTLAPATPVPTQSTCYLYTTCGTCTNVGACGWCSFNNQCQQGNATGSFQGCVAPYWSWTYNQCQATSVPTPAPALNVCSPYTTCYACTQQPSCGFCFSTSQCQTGNVTGSGACNGTNWAWTNAQCSQ